MAALAERSTNADGEVSQTATLMMRRAHHLPSTAPESDSRLAQAGGSSRRLQNQNTSAGPPAVVAQPPTPGGDDPSTTGVTPARTTSSPSTDGLLATPPNDAQGGGRGDGRVRRQQREEPSSDAKAPPRARADGGGRTSARAAPGVTGKSRRQQRLPDRSTNRGAEAGNTPHEPAASQRRWWRVDWSWFKRLAAQPVHTACAREDGLAVSDLHWFSHHMYDGL
eukprot:COSAG01_NODE_1564_length_9896_cov_4.868837_6_plen_223_part_00